MRMNMCLVSLHCNTVYEYKYGFYTVSRVEFEKTLVLI
jgi:hypothetical protein